MALSNFGRKMFSYKGLTLMTAPVAVVIAAGSIMGASAALSANTDNAGNSWATASTQLSLDNSNSTSALFTAVDMAAGYTETHCITITNTSPIPATIKAWGTNPQGSTVLSDELALNVVTGTGGVEDGLTGAGDHCAGFIADAVPAVYSGALTNYAQPDYSTGFGSKVLAVGESVQYQVTTSLPQNADVFGALSELSTGMDFRWEVQG